MAPVGVRPDILSGKPPKLTAGRRSPVLTLAAPRFYTSGSHACSGTREEESPKANQQRPASPTVSQESGAELKDFARAALAPQRDPRSRGESAYEHSKMAASACEAAQQCNVSGPAAMPIATPAVIEGSRASDGPDGCSPPRASPHQQGPVEDGRRRRRKVPTGGASKNNSPRVCLWLSRPRQSQRPLSAPAAMPVTAPAVTEGSRASDCPRQVLTSKGAVLASPLQQGPV
ncbi:hypothetical protein NDU88_002021 [Pleurodeles waltl]|uniref:Uncharacterized protein n=1 Tax=Pleurodeles waltl TaxID=8319 RepID=A0AAV7UUC4_PLEWA|nr:hypothetical protein NDU88_002021 [Pleurodeles waltl]